MNSIGKGLMGKETCWAGEGSPREAGDGCIGPGRLGAGHEGPVLAGCCQGNYYQKDWKDHCVGEGWG